MLLPRLARSGWPPQAPKRISARLELTLEDIAQVGQENFEAVLRQNTSACFV